MVDSKRRFQSIHRQLSFVHEDTRIVDQDMKSAAAVRDIRGKLANLLQRGKICDEQINFLISGRSANFLDDVSAACGITAVDKNRRAQGGKLKRCLPANTIRGSGNENNFVRHGEYSFFRKKRELFTELFWHKEIAQGEVTSARKAWHFENEYTGG
jgi:hypothetical protein